MWFLSTTQSLLVNRHRGSGQSAEDKYVNKSFYFKVIWHWQTSPRLEFSIIEIIFHSFLLIIVEWAKQIQEYRIYAAEIRILRYVWGLSENKGCVGEGVDIWRINKKCGLFGLPIWCRKMLSRWLDLSWAVGEALNDQNWPWKPAVSREGCDRMWGDVGGPDNNWGVVFECLHFNHMCSVISPALLINRS